MIFSAFLHPKRYIKFLMENSEIVDFYKYFWIYRFEVQLTAAFLFGKYLHRTWLYEFMKKYIIGKYERKIYAFGWLFIVVAAITPLPFSASAAVIGAVGFDRKKYLFYSLARFIRYLIYGFFIWLAHPF